MRAYRPFADEAETFISSLKEKGIEKKEALVDEAKDAGSNFSDVAVDKIATWIDEAKSKLDTAHTAVKSKLDTDAPVKKPVASKSPKA